MTQENKDLLLKDLCARLPYNTIVKTNTDNINVSFTWLELKKLVEGDKFMCKPYLRSISSMTEEEIKEFTSIHENVFVAGKNVYTAILGIDSVNWLLENHFDFMGLIPKKLAIEVTEDNNPYKD